MKKLQAFHIILVGSFTLIPCFFDFGLVNVNTLHRLAISIFLTVGFAVAIFDKKIYSLEGSEKLIVVMFLLFVLAAFVSSWINNLLVKSLPAITVYLTYLLILVVFIKFKIPTLTFHTVFGVTLTISVGILLCQFFLTYFGILPKGWFVSGSLLSHRFFIAEYLVVVFPFVLYTLLYRTQKRWETCVVLLLLGSLVLAILLMRSRIGILSVIVTIGVLFVFEVKKEKQNYKTFNRFKIFLIVVALVAVSDVFLNHQKERESLLETTKSAFNFTVPENTSRLKYWQGSIEMFLHNPLFGVGIENWFDKFNLIHPELYDDYKAKITSDIYPHNVYLQILSEAGLIAFLLFFCFLFEVLKKLKNGFKQDVFFLFVILSLLNLLLCSGVGFTINNVSAMSVVIIGITASLPSQQFSCKDTNRGFMKIVLFLMALLVAFYSYKSYESEKNYVVAMKEKAKRNYVQVIKQYDNISDIFYPVDANKIPTKFYLGAAYFGLGKFYDALNIYLSALKISPDLPPLKNNIALTNYMLGDTLTAVNILEHLCSNTKMYIEPEINLLFIYFTMKDYNKSRAIINDIKSKCWDTTSVSNYYILRFITAEMERIDEANGKK